MLCLLAALGVAADAADADADAAEPLPASVSAASSAARQEGGLKRRVSLGGLGLGRPVALELGFELQQAPALAT